MSENTFRIGDSVVVKPGVKDPDTGSNIGGWQGHIEDIVTSPNGETLVLIQWDSITLAHIPHPVIEQCRKEGLDWSTISLPVGQIGRAKPRDTRQDALRIKEQIEKRHYLEESGGQGRRIQEVLEGVSIGDEIGAFEAWYEYLETLLCFPFAAEICEFRERGPLPVGSRVSVLALAEVEDLYGVLVEVRHKRGRFTIPLCDLEVLDIRSPNYQPVEDYRAWFANR